MIEATEVLRSYLGGIRRLSGAGCVTLFVPSSLSGQSMPLLLHEGPGRPVAELEDEARAVDFTSRFDARDADPEAGAERPSLVGGAEPDTILIPLPTLEPIWYWGLHLEDGEKRDEERRRRTDARTGPQLLPAAWLGLRMGGTPADGQPIPREFPPESGSIDSSEWFWHWLFTLGGGIAGHTTQVEAILRDPITGLPDRMGLQALLSEGLERARLLGGESLSLLLVNPDGFGAVNERFGREAGDQIIREISQRLRNGLRRSDLVARFGGVIFATVLLDSDLETAHGVAEKILPVLMEASYLAGAVRLGFSIGIATAEPADVEVRTPLDLIRRADQALNSAKRRGGGCIAGWDRETSTEETGAFDRLSGIFTGNMAKDYRNMVLLSDALEVIAVHHDFDGLAREVVERLYSTFKTERVALFDRDEKGELVQVRGLTRRPPGSGGEQVRIETVELSTAEWELLRLAVAGGEPREARLPDERGERMAYAVPLLASGRCLGALYIDGLLDSLVLESSDLVVLRTLCAQLAVALDRARLAEREQQRQEHEKKQLRAELNDLRQALQQAKMVFRSPQMDGLVATARRVAPTDATVLITGESGTGKELLARTVHELSPRREQPWVVVDCGSIATSLIESELFGHEKGAYTGAQQRRAGRLAEANGGTVLLDEIGELPLEVQSKLLRFVQEKQFITVGGTRPRRVDVRIVAATNRDLAAEVAAGSFREDLFHRLNVVRLEIPPLRERPEDILHLARHFVESYSIQYQKSAHRLSAEAERALLAYDWPGNVRELQNRLMQAVILSEGNEIGIDQISLPPPSQPPAAEAAATAIGARAPGTDAGAGEPQAATESGAVMGRLREALARQVDQALAAGSHAAFPLGKWLAEDLVLEANAAAGGIARRGAAIVGIPETTFRRRLHKADDQAQAGFSPRTGTWDHVRSILGELVRAPDAGEADLLSRVERELLEEILARVPNDTSTGSKLLGVTPPTYRSRVAQLGS